MKNNNKLIIQHLEEFLTNSVWAEELSDMLQSALDAFVDSKIDEEVAHSKESAFEARATYFHIRRLIDILTLRGYYTVKDNSYPEEPPIRPIHSVEDLKYNLNPEISKKTNRKSSNSSQPLEY